MLIFFGQIQLYEAIKPQFYTVLRAKMSGHNSRQVKNGRLKINCLYIISMLAMQRRSENNHCSCYSLYSFSPAKRDFVPKFPALNLIKKPKNSSEDAKGVPRKSECWGCPKSNILFLTAKYYLESLVPAGPDVARKFQT